MRKKAEEAIPEDQVLAESGEVLQTDFEEPIASDPEFMIQESPQTDLEAATPEQDLVPAAPEPQPESGSNMHSELAALPADQTDLESGNPSDQLPDVPQTEMPKDSTPAAPKQAIKIDRRQYIKTSERVVTIDGTPGVSSQAEQIERDLLDIVESLKGGRILTDTLQGVERTGITGEPMAVLTHGAFKVVIPASEMIDLPGDLRGRTPNEVYYMLLHKRMGAEIDYIIKGISPDDTVAAASRKDAMAVRRRRFYFGKDRDGNNLLYEDACAEARVTCVFGGGIVVDLFGVETYIPLRELSWQRISRAQDKFSPGDRVVVRIQELDRSDRENILVKPSVRLAMTNPYDEALRKYSVESCYVGKVSHIDTNGIFVALDGGIDCLCTFPPRGRPPIGSRVSVYILGKDEERHRIWGVIIHAAVPMMN